MKKIFAILTALVFSATVFAQGDMSEVEAWLPKFIKDNNGASKEIPKDQTWQQWCENKLKTEGLGERTGQYWIVYSDRENNPTYKDASLSTPTGRTLKFREPLYVAKIQNGAAYVYSSIHKQTFPKIKKADFKGWVPIENLLLWDNCPKSKSMVYQKALVVYNPSEDNSTTGPLTETKFLLAPYEGAPASQSDANSLDILFVMKKVKVGDKAYYLLSNQYNNKDIQSSLYGWLPSEFVNPWDYRLALEPTYERLRVNKYTAAGLKPAFYSRFEEANRFFEKGMVGRPLYLYENFGTKRMDPLIMRYPILDSSENHYIYQVAVTASLDGKSGGGKDYQERKADAQRKIDELNQRQSHINIIFVIDATNSMKEFYPALVNALKSIQSYNFFSNSDTRSLIKFGAVLYRDSKREPEYFALNHDVDKLVAFLNVKTTPDGKDDRVDMFSGIETALDCKKMGYQPYHSNYLILLGDAGNVEKTKDGSRWVEACAPLADKLAENRINFLAYQIRNTGAGVYGDFIAQVRKMQQDLTNKYIQTTHAEMDYSRKGNVIKLVRKSTEGDDLPVYSRIEYAEEGETKEASVITGSIVAHVQSFYEAINQRIIKYNRLADGGYRFGNDAEEEAVREELRLAGWDEGKIDRTVRFMKQGGVAKFNTFAPVMTKTQALSTRYPIYNFVLFFSGDELTDLIRNLDKIVNNDRGDVRVAYRDAVSTMGKAMLGEFSQSEINSMDINELMGQIYGVPVNITTKELRINEIGEAKEETIRELMVGFKQKLELLRDISNGGEEVNKSRFERNGMAYYWIPIEVMPGFTITMD